MIKDRLKLGRKKIPDSVVKAIRKERKKGLTYAALAKKYGISRSYVRYLTLEGEQKERWKQKMRENSRKFYAEHPDKFDPREYLKPARANIKEMVRHKLIHVLGCNGKA